MPYVEGQAGMQVEQLEQAETGAEMEVEVGVAAEPMAEVEEEAQAPGDAVDSSEVSSPSDSE